MYQIYFQNTGNAPADRVVVRDPLDNHLNINSIRNITASHDMKVSVSEGNDQLLFEFNNINLPDSTTDYAGSIGYIQYEIDLECRFACRYRNRKTSRDLLRFQRARYHQPQCPGKL